MKRKDLKNFVNKSVKELEKEVETMKAQSSSISMQLMGRRLKNTNAVKNLKKSIAQLSTILRQKELNNENK
jgi:large subunit ribosomal protein L29